MIRHRLKTLIAAVALAAFLLGGLALRRRSRACEHRALLHEVLAVRIGHHFRQDSGLNGRTLPAYTIYHRALAAKYHAAASRPWLSIGPDPDPPPIASPAEMAESAARFEKIAAEALAAARAFRPDRTTP